MKWTNEKAKNSVSLHSVNLSTWHIGPLAWFEIFTLLAMGANIFNAIEVLWY